MAHHVPFVRNEVPSLVHVVLAQEVSSTNIIPFRKRTMTSFDNVVDAARQNAKSGSDLASAAGQIIAKRVALGVAAIIDPMRADHAEFGRMVPEKIEAFSAAGIILMQQAGQACEHFTRFASDAVGRATRAKLAIAGSANPVEIAEKQGHFAAGWFGMAASNFMTMGLLALNAQKAVMLPIQQTIAANAERLGR
jgi:hypothetical protein